MNYQTERVLALLALLVLCLMTLNVPAAAQEATAEPLPEETLPPLAEPAPEVTEAPTVEPPPEITDMPADTVPEEPTVEPTVTLEPPPEATALPEVTETPDSVTLPPVFDLPDGATFEVTAGVPLALRLNISDEAGLVRVVVSDPAPLGGVTLTATAPVETLPPYVTVVDMLYLAPAEFSGADAITLLALDASGATAAAVITVHVTAYAPSPTPEPEPKLVEELLISYNPAAPESAIQELLASLGAVEISRLPAIGVLRARVPEAVSEPAAAVAQLQTARPAAYLAAGVTAVETNDAYALHVYKPTDPLYPQQWALAGGSGGIYASEAWDVSTTRGTGITVAVVDSGIDLQHPELSAKLVPGWDFFNDDNNPDDNIGHGTHVAGIIAARANNSAGIAGVAFNAKVMPVKVCDIIVDPISGSYLGCPYYYIAAGIIHAVDKGARVINLSLGGAKDSPTVKGAVDYALARNVVVVASAGNDGDTTNHVSYPAAYPGVISVAAHDNEGIHAPFSTSNPFVDISAPGVNILSTVPAELDSDPGTPVGYALDDGTSMAAPHVSGVAALLLSAKVATTPATVLDALICGAEDAGAPGFDPEYGHGRLKADYSMNWRNNSASCKVTLPNDRLETPTLVRTVPFNAVQPVSDRSVTEQAGDPLICGAAREQTLWYAFKPSASGFYQFSTLGASYAPVFGVYQGVAGSWREVGCSTNRQAVLSLQAGQQYYIVVGTTGAAVNDQVLQLQINLALPLNNADYQENAAGIAYTGMWARGAVSGASGGYTQQTSDLNAAASFSFRGVGFYYVRTVGPDKGAVQIWVNGAPLDTNPDPNVTEPLIISNRAAVTRGNQGGLPTDAILIPDAVPGQWNTVRIVRDPGTPGMVDLDRVRTFDYDGAKTSPAITTKANDRDTRLLYSPAGTGTHWTNVDGVAAAYVKTLKETGVENATVAFRMTGSALTIFRMTGPGMPAMQVMIDSDTPLVVSNEAPDAAIRPYTIDGLVSTAHVVEIRKLGAGGVLQLDAVQPFVQATLAANVNTDERAAALAYRGVWLDAAGVGGANAGTTRTLAAGSEVSFRFNGTDLCVGYQRNGGGTLAVYVDDLAPVTITDAGGGGIVRWCLDADANRMVPVGVHHARLVVTAGSFTLDYLRAQTRSILTPARGLVQESDVAFVYNNPANWLRVTSATPVYNSPYKPQGGYLKQTDTDNSTVTFYINGSGFLLYTAVGSGQGCWEVNVDGANVDIDLNPSGTYDVIDYDLRTRPIGYGITDLVPGIHRVQLVADADCSSFGYSGSRYLVNLDGIRVFP